MQEFQSMLFHTWTDVCGKDCSHQQDAIGEMWKNITDILATSEIYTLFVFICC